MSQRISKTLLVIAILIVSLRAVKASGSTSLFAMFSSAISKAFGWLSPTQSNSLLNIVNSFDKFGDGDINKLLYIIATAYHESKLAPVREIRGAVGTPLYNRQESYWKTGYYGRGFVQLTHERNYKTMGEIFNVDLVNNPDLALQPVLAADILVYGMINGSFTGRRLSQYINDSRQDYFEARRVVNALDQAQLITDYTLMIKANIESIAA
jgi:hypothetical protein